VRVRSDRLNQAAVPSRPAVPSRAGDRAAADDSRAAPVIILSYGYSGAEHIQQALSGGTDLACTAGTGILPVCEMAATAWARVVARPGGGLSALARSSIRTLVSTQITCLLSAAGKRRWCELATATPQAAQTFLQIMPESRFVCVHRACPGVIAAAITAEPWGLTSLGLSAFTLAYPGNSAAAMAAYWAAVTEQLMAFQAAHPQSSSLVRYEDMIADADHALAGVRSSLGLDPAHPGPGGPGPDVAQPPENDRDRGPVPVHLIPAALRQRVDQLHAKLGYPPLAG